MKKDPSKETEFAQFEARFGKDAVNHMIDKGVEMLLTNLFVLEEAVNPEEIIVTAEALPKEVLGDFSSEVILRFSSIYPRTDKTTGKHISPTVVIWGEIIPKNTGNIWKQDFSCTTEK